MSLAEAAAALNLRAGLANPRACGLPPLLLMTDERRLADPCAAVAKLPPGSGIILRHYVGGLMSPERVALAHALARMCRARGIRLIVAATPALARRVGAGGVHLPEWQLRRPPTGLERGARVPGWIVTAACHSRAALVAAARIGADAALVAPVFPTPSHPGAPPLGVLRFAGLVRASPIPVYALGGVTRSNARRLAGTGAAGIAGIGAIIGA